MFLDEHRHSSSETPHGASLSLSLHLSFSLFLRIGIHRSRRVQVSRNRSSSSSNNDSSNTQNSTQFHNRAIAKRTLDKLIGNSIDDGSAAACPNTATCRFLAPGKRVRATTYCREIIRSPVRKRRSLSSPAKTGGNLGFACRFQTNSTTYLTISMSSLLAS